MGRRTVSESGTSGTRLDNPPSSASGHSTKSVLGCPNPTSGGSPPRHLDLLPRVPPNHPEPPPPGQSVLNTQGPRRVLLTRPREQNNIADPRRGREAYRATRLRGAA